MAVADPAYLDPAAFGHAYVIITRVGEELTITDQNQRTATNIKIPAWRILKSSLLVEVGHGSLSTNSSTCSLFREELKPDLTTCTLILSYHCLWFQKHFL